MSAHENKRLLERAYAGAAAGDSQLLFEMLADDVVWTVMGTATWSGTFRGKAELMERLLKPLGEVLDGPLAVTAERMIAEGELVAVQASIHNRTKAGEPYPNHYFNLFRFEAGKIVEVSEYADTQLMNAVLGIYPGAEAAQ